MTKPKQNKKKPPPSPEVSVENDDSEQMKEDIAYFRQQITTLKRQNNELTELSETCKQTLADHKKQILIANLEIRKLKETVAQMQQQIAAQQQEDLKYDLEIAGVYEKENENLCQIVTRAALKVEVKISERDIAEAVRIGSKVPRFPGPSQENQTPRIIIVTMLRRRQRDELLRAGKFRRNITSVNVVEGAIRTIYFNERLTLENRQLFHLARERCSQHAFQYCWVRDGGIYVRESDGKSAIQITKASELDEKVGILKVSEVPEEEDSD